MSKRNYIEHFHGHPTVEVGECEDRYLDTGKRVPWIGWDRPCAHCGLKSKGEEDPCLGILPGVVAACCGHGKNRHFSSYVYFEKGLIIRGVWDHMRDIKHGR